MLAKEELSIIKDRVRRLLDDSLTSTYGTISWRDCLGWIYDRLFQKVNYTKSRLMPSLDTYTSLFAEYFGESGFSVGEDSATVTTPYDVFVFTDKGKGSVELMSREKPGFSRWATCFEPRDLVGFIADTIDATSAIEPVWKEYEPTFLEKERVACIESRYSLAFRQLTNEYASAIFAGNPVGDIEDRIRKTEAERQLELGMADGGSMTVEQIKARAEKQAEEWRKSEERSRRIREAHQKKKEEREARFKRYAKDLEDRLGVRPTITHRVPVSGGKHYDAYEYPLPSGQRVLFKYYTENFDEILKDAEALLPPIRILSEVSSTKLKLSSTGYEAATMANVQSWNKKALVDLGDRSALKEMVSAVKSERVSFHVNQRYVVARIFINPGGHEYLSVSLAKTASEENVTAFAAAVDAFSVADYSLRMRRNISYSFV